MMGVQGSGKGTQAGIIRDAYNLVHISTGDLFRALKHREDEFAKKIQAIMASGQLVSDEDTNELLRQHLESIDLKNGVILDGYPRTTAQAEWLETYLQSKGQKLTAVIALELDPYIAFKRSFGRLIHPQDSTKAWNIYYNTDGLEYEWVKSDGNLFPPRLSGKTSETGEALTRRPDDASADAVLKRIDTYLATTAPLVAYYQSKGILTTINADRPIEAVTAEMKSVIDG
jgi:adenylate kinase